MEKKFPLNKREYLEVIDFIKEKHSGQFRRFTLAPYFVHPIQTAVLLMKYKQSHKIDELVIAALLHDTVEDTETSFDEIYNRYGKIVMSLVEELTTNKAYCERVGKPTYLKEKMTKMSSWGLCIKLCDRLSNVSDFMFASPDFIKKYKEETYTILAHISTNRELSETHENIIRDIYRIISIY